MAADNVLFKSAPKQMSDSWIVIDEHDEADFVVIDTHGHDQDHDHEDHEQQPQSSVRLIPTAKASPQAKRLLGQTNNNNNKPSKLSQGGNTNKQQNKRRKWKVLYSLPATGIKANVDDSNLDSYVMDQHAQLFDKRDLFSYQPRIVKVK